MYRFNRNPDVVDAFDDDDGRVTPAEIRQAIQTLAGDHQYCEQCGDCVTCMVCCCPPTIEPSTPESLSVTRLRNPLNPSEQTQWMY